MIIYSSPHLYTYIKSNTLPEHHQIICHESHLKEEKKLSSLYIYYTFMHRNNKMSSRFFNPLLHFFLVYKYNNSSNDYLPLVQPISWVSLENRRSRWVSDRPFTDLLSCSGCREGTAQGFLAK